MAPQDFFRMGVWAGVTMSPPPAGAKGPGRKNFRWHLRIFFAWGSGLVSLGDHIPPGPKGPTEIIPDDPSRNFSHGGLQVCLQVTLAQHKPSQPHHTGVHVFTFLFCMNALCTIFRLTSLHLCVSHEVFHGFTHGNIVKWR